MQRSPKGCAEFRAAQTARVRAMTLPRRRMIAPGALLGLLGGGQLGRMFTMAAQSMGYRVMVLDPGAHSPAGSPSPTGTSAAEYLDRAGLDELGSCAAVTTEFENVPAEALERLAGMLRRKSGRSERRRGAGSHPEKQFLVAHGLETAPFAVIDERDDLGAALDSRLLPGNPEAQPVRLRRQGPGAGADPRAGSGGVCCHGREPCVLERLLPLELEISVVVARGFDGAMVRLSRSRRTARAGHSRREHRARADIACRRRSCARSRRHASRRSSTITACCASSSSWSRRTVCSRTRSHRVLITAATTHRRLRHVAVRAAGAGDGRAAARRYRRSTALR